MKFSRPGGTCADADNDPALKRRAIFGLSRWRVLRIKKCSPLILLAETGARYFLICSSGPMTSTFVWA
jgi:hypothetical protein